MDDRNVRSVILKEVRKPGTDVNNVSIIMGNRNPFENLPSTAISDKWYQEIIKYRSELSKLDLCFSGDSVIVKR